jgi:hypothetical protein
MRNDENEKAAIPSHPGALGFNGCRCFFSQGRAAALPYQNRVGRRSRAALKQKHCGNPARSLINSLFSILHPRRLSPPRLCVSALILLFLSLTAPAQTTPNFGSNVLVFDTSMLRATIQSQLDSVFSLQQNNQFGTNRYCLLFKPGTYTNFDVNIGYYTEVRGLGQMPDDVTIAGNVHSDGVLANHNATVNFWRSCENFAITPTNSNTL